MLDSTIFKITQLTTATATILASAYVIVNKGAEEAFFFFIGGCLFTIILRLIEQTIFDYNCYHGNYYKMGN